MNVVLTYFTCLVGGTLRPGQHKGLVLVAVVTPSEEQNFGRTRPEISAKVLGSGQISLTLCKVPSNLTAWKQCKSHSCWSSRLGQVPLIKSH